MMEFLVNALSQKILALKLCLTIPICSQKISELYIICFLRMHDRQNCHYYTEFLCSFVMSSLDSERFPRLDLEKSQDLRDRSDMELRKEFE